MHNWFKGKVSYEKPDENGIIRKVTELYLIDAMSFTEAESRLIEKTKEFVSGDFIVSDISRKRVSEIFFNEEGDYFYDVKVEIISLDEKTYKEKRTSFFMIAQASSVKKAIQVIEDGMKGQLEDYRIAAIVETCVVDIFPYDSKDNSK